MKESASSSPIPDGLETVIRTQYRSVAGESAERVRIVRVEGPDGSVRAYASSLRGKFPDAYFDAHGKMLLSVSGVLRFDGGPDSTPAARDALRLAGLSVRFGSDGTMSWASDRIPGAPGSRSVEPFGPVAYRLLSDVAFHQDRIDVFRRIEWTKRGGAKLPPLSEAGLAELVSAKSLTIADFVRMKEAGAIRPELFSKYRDAVAARLPEQLLDGRFAARIDAKNPDGSPVSIAPSWHGIDAAAVESLHSAGHLNAAVRKACLENLALLRRQAEEYGIVRDRTHASAESLKREVRGK